MNENHRYPERNTCKRSPPPAPGPPATSQIHQAAIRAALFLFRRGLPRHAGPIGTRDPQLSAREPPLPEGRAVLEEVGEMEVSRAAAKAVTSGSLATVGGEWGADRGGWGGTYGHP